MKQVKSVIQNIAAGRNIEADNQKLVSRLRQDKRIHEFAVRNPDIEKKEWLKNLAKLYQYTSEWAHCDQCSGLGKCPNMLAGYQPHLLNDKGAPSLTFAPCPLKQADEAKRRQAALIKSYYVPKDTLTATFESIDKIDPGRQKAIKAAGDFVREYLEDPEHVKGLYFYGEFGIGKTYIMGAVMNKLAERRHIASLMVYTPDFFREIKGAIQDNTVDDKLDMLKTTPVLILDDIGAETMTPWIRDEVLGSILQYRMMEHLPTLYTSNYDYDELENHLSYSQKSGTEKLKAKRIMERIRHFTTLVTIEGSNRR